jgi:hypothetical protein
MAKDPRDLRRYTDLSTLFYLLAERKLTLLNPSGWDDRNDSYCLRQYGKAKGHNAVFALCFVQSSERYHLWKVFGAGASGVRIKFKRKAFLEAADKVPGLRHGQVQYLTLKKLEDSFKADRLPFLKRYGFLGEDEYRLVYGSEKHYKHLPKFDIDIRPDCIESVKLNPWLDADLFEHVKNALRKVDSCWRGLKVEHSSLIDNERWREFADRISRTGA